MMPRHRNMTAVRNCAGSYGGRLGFIGWREIRLQGEGMEPRWGDYPRD